MVPGSKIIFKDNKDPSYEEFKGYPFLYTSGIGPNECKSLGSQLLMASYMEGQDFAFDPSDSYQKLYLLIPCPVLKNKIELFVERYGVVSKWFVTGKLKEEFEKVFED